MRTDVICFGGEDWWYKNRGHNDMQLMKRFARHGTVLYINSIVMQKPNFKEGRRFFKKLIRKTKSIFRGLKKSDAGFWVYSPFSLPFHHIAWAKRFNERLLYWQVSLIKHKLKMNDPVVWVACPAAADVAIKMSTNKLVYQRTDRYEEYPNVDSETIKKYDRRAKERADLTIFASNSLFQQEAKQCRNPFFLDHGVDYDEFSAARDIPCKPDDIANVPKPIVGFFGAIDCHTSDINLVEQVVGLLPELSFVFVGKASLDLSGLQGKSNVWLLGPKPYEQIPHYGKFFDVAIMPWQQNRWIEACNPIKLKEYLALGKPVVSTPFGELVNYTDVVYKAKNAVEFAGCIKKALKDDNEELVAARKKKVETMSWDHKAQQVIEQLFGDGHR